MRHSTSTSLSDHSRSSEAGSVMLVLVIMLVTVATVVTSQLTVIMGEQRAVEKRYHAHRAMAEAIAELEIAKNIVNASSYVAGQNTVLQQAVSSAPPFVPGTRVMVTRVGSASAPWFRLRARGEEQGVSKLAQAYVRETRPMTSYSFFVEDHPLGVSGAPRGAIHTNRQLKFYFPWGLYRDSVTASEGFGYEAGATEGNTRIYGPSDPHSPVKELLAGRAAADYASKPTTYKVVDDLVAELTIDNTSLHVDLFAQDQWVEVERTGIRQVFSHYEQVPYEEQVPVYTTNVYDVEEPVYETEVVLIEVTNPIYDTEEVTITETVPIYEEQTVTTTALTPVYAERTVLVEVTEEVWVEDPPPTEEEISGGISVGGGNEDTVTGHWETVTSWEEVTETYISHYEETEITTTQQVQVGTETVTRTETNLVVVGYETVLEETTQLVQTGTQTVQVEEEVFSHYETVTKYADEPVYIEEEYTYTETELVPGELVRSETTAANGLVYFEGSVRRLSGQLNGQMTIVSNGKITLTGSLQYVDDEGDTRMLNGTDPDQPYDSNPAYDGSSVLGVVAQDDILYGLEMPSRVELNASLMSLGGKIGFEVLSVTEDTGDVYVDESLVQDPSTWLKESIRRLGGVACRKRPAAAILDENNELLAGFQTGVAMMDRGLILEEGGIAPPSALEENEPVWSLSSAGQVVSVQ